MKKALFSLLAAFALTLGASAAETLNLTMKDGKVHSFVLAEKPVVTMGDNQLCITTTNATATYNLYDVSRYTFGGATAIGATNAEKPVQISTDRVLFGGVEAQHISVCTLGGTPVGAAVERTAEGASVSLGSLPAGVYIVKAAGVAVKVNKK